MTGWTGPSGSRSCWPRRAWTRSRPRSSSPPAASQIAAARDRAKQDLADAQNALNDAVYAARGLQDKAAEVNAELVSLREHPNNIPKHQLDLRAWMCRELRLERRHCRSPGS